MSESGSSSYIAESIRESTKYWTPQLMNCLPMPLRASTVRAAESEPMGDPDTRWQPPQLTRIYSSPQETGINPTWVLGASVRKPGSSSTTPPVKSCWFGQEKRQPTCRHRRRLCMSAAGAILENSCAACRP